MHPHTCIYTPPHTHTVTDDPKNIPDLSPASSGVPGKCLSLAARGHVEHFLSRPVCWTHEGGRGPGGVTGTLRQIQNCQESGCHSSNRPMASLNSERVPHWPPWEQTGLWAPRTRRGVFPGTLTPSIRVSSSSRRKVPHAGGYSLRDSLRTYRGHARKECRNPRDPMAKEQSTLSPSHSH